MSGIAGWFDSSLGQRMLAEESAALEQILPHLFGYHLLQIGEVGYGRLFAGSRIPHRCLLAPRPLPAAHLQASPEALPFASDSVDLVLLPHLLEFERNPHQILREVERILIGDGHVLILGFNPFSLWGLRRWLAGGGRPWAGRSLSATRIKDWLKLLDFELVTQQTLCFSPSFQPRLLDLERLGRRVWPYFGAIYLLVAQKRRIPLSLIRPHWQPRAALVGAPTARSRP
jgi:SAM-dependent methyltransferase